MGETKVSSLLRLSRGSIHCVFVVVLVLVIWVHWCIVYLTLLAVCYLMRLSHTQITPYYPSFPATFLKIESLDAFLVSPAENITYLLNFDGDEEPNVEGMHFNLYNNLWGTAFPQWYDDDGMFRFTLNFGP